MRRCSELYSLRVQRGEQEDEEEEREKEEESSHCYRFSFFHRLPLPQRDSPRSLTPALGPSLSRVSSCIPGIRHVALTPDDKGFRR